MPKQNSNLKYSSCDRHGELVNKREELGPALKRAMESGKPACVNVKAKPVLSPIVSAVASKREKSSIE